MKAKRVDQVLDSPQTKPLNFEQKRVNVDFPTWMISSLDQEAKRLGVTRQSIIKIWLAERLEVVASNRINKINDVAQ